MAGPTRARVDTSSRSPIERVAVALPIGDINRGYGPDNPSSMGIKSPSALSPFSSVPQPTPTTTTTFLFVQTLVLLHTYTHESAFTSDNMLRITAVALASLAVAAIQPMGVVGKVNGSDSAPGAFVAPINPQPSGSGAGLTHGAARLRRATCQSGQYSSGSGCTNCGAGYYCTGDGTRKACPAGTWTDQTVSKSQGECKTVQCGNRPTGGNGDGTASTGQVACGAGSYSKAGSTSCTTCPAGYYCNAQTTCDPTPCDPGTYAPSTGSTQQCQNCPAGTFNNSYGNTSCCQCCAGWFNTGDNNHTNCQQCPNIDQTQSIKVTGPAGSNSPLNCLVYTGLLGQQPPVSTCSQARPSTRTPGTCPAVYGPTPSGAMKRQAPTKCMYGTTRCEVKSGRGGWECVDTLNSLETCGGCENDCSLLEGTNGVSCVKGHCVVESCASGYTLALRGDGISRGGLDVGQHCVAKKRANRARHASSML